MQYVFYTLMFVVGACMGSFLCCQARRLHEREEKHKKLGSRSVCMSCKYQLKWYDNIPIISWLLLRGRCRKCHKKIGIAEILSELAVAAAFTLISLSFNVETATLMPWLTFISMLLLTLSLSFLGIYDGLYGELPCFCLTISLICAIIYSICAGLSSYFLFGFTPEIITLPLLSALFFGGIYLILYFFSKGKWVGDGDWLLAGIIGLALGSIWLSFFALFIANLSACLIMLPAVIKNKNTKIYFGPFLVLAFVLVFTFAEQLLSLVTF